jgi:unsaturated rhamnogalacturonyl hydrolase
MTRILLAAIAFVGTFCSCGTTGAQEEKKTRDSTVATIGTTVLLDNYFNNEWKDENGARVAWHYLWSDTSMGGYSELGALFKKEGAALATLKEAPTSENLKTAAVYIIADPDNEKETAAPNFMTEAYATTVADWVKAGGVLVLFGNDSTNCELDRFNILAEKFGIRFNKDNRLVVQDPHFEQGQVNVNTGNPVFKTAKNVYIKGISSVTATAPAEIILKADGFDVMAVGKYGAGTVFALGDPWIYNEYIGHRRLPEQFENDKAAADWVKWLLETASN